MQFSTPIPVKKIQTAIGYDSTIVSIGSCFAENMGDKFNYFKFRSIVNPFGIIFNPVSIERLFERVVKGIKFSEADVFFHNERWHCFEVHSDLSAADKNEFLERLNQMLEATREQIVNMTHCIITYGTSWVYRSKTSAAIVANCHKVPQNQFDKEVLSVPIIEKSIGNTIHYIRKINPDCQLIFTVSPVRHIKDGFVENQRSKAHLITALHEFLTSNFQLPTPIYFPSYEIMMDELRDYRFYNEDMLHPNEVAIKYIWERWQQSAIKEESYPVMKEIESIQKALAHRPFNMESDSYKEFSQQLNQKIIRLKKQFSYIEF